MERVWEKEAVCVVRGAAAVSMEKLVRDLVCEIRANGLRRQIEVEGLLLSIEAKLGIR